MTMIIREIYKANDLNKSIVETKNEDWLISVYYWVAKYADSKSTWYTWPSSVDSPIWRIRKSTYNPSTWEYEYSYPDGNVWFDYKRSDRYNLNYNWPTITVYISLEDWDRLVTEWWDPVILW